MATDQESDALWNMSVTNKSWVELAEEEDVEFAMMNRSTGCFNESNTKNGESSFKLESETIIKGVQATVCEKSSIQVVTIPVDKMTARDVPSIITEEESCDVYDRGILSTISEESHDTLESPPLKNVTQTYANILKNSPNSPAPLVTIKTETKQTVTKELSKDFLHEDISLTGHIQGFQLASPCKEAKEPAFKTPTKTLEVPGIRSSPRSLKRKILQEGVKVPDEVLMPSPSKIPRPSEVNSPRPTSNIGSSNSTGKRYSTDRANRKRPRDLQTPPSNRRQNWPARELETNEEVLARRQKQIDYGKNTIGYERYRQLVPKEARKTIHPKTPPMHQKYSRRAWEGLVRIWRQRLHFWDPPSEGGGDPTCLESDYGDMSDVSSTDGSLPSTPVQDLKRRQIYISPASGGGSGIKHQRTDAAKSLASSISKSSSTFSDPKHKPDLEDFDDQGCQPLTP